MPLSFERRPTPNGFILPMGTAAETLSKVTAVRYFLIITFFCTLGCGSAETTDARTETSDQRSKSESPPLRNARLPVWDELGVQPRETRDDDWFEDVTDEAGVRFAFRDGREKSFYTLLEVVGGGVASFDYDQDGDMDLFFAGGGNFEGPPIRVVGHPAALFRNDGNWKFVDVSNQLGLADVSLYTHGCTVGDFDRDGFPDLFVAGFGGCKLYRNVNGRRFEDVTDDSGLVCNGWNVAAACLDYDRDGNLDLYVVTYCDWKPDHTRRCRNERKLRDVCGPTKFKGARDHLFRNRGDGKFVDVTDKAGLVERNRGLGLVTADFDEDGWMDIFVANDAQENQLYLGSSELPFDEQGVVKGIAYSLSGEREGSMGVDVGDFDGDELADIFYTNYTSQDNSLMRQLPGGGYLNIGDISGVVGMSRRWVGFGTGFADFDNDGWSDLFVANGHVAYEWNDIPFFQPAQLFANNSGKKLADVSQQGGPYFSVPHAGRGAAVCDLDNDGSLDIAIVHQGDPVVILRNRNENHSWIRVLLRGTESNIDAVGAKVTARMGERNIVRWVRGGGGYLSYNDPRILIPLGRRETADVVVNWPSGKRERFESLPARESHVLVEGEGKCEAVTHE